MVEAPSPDAADIEPSTFDLIVIGTGFQEALLAGAAAQAGKSVLHLDPAGSYGAHWASLRLDAFLDWAQAQQQRQPQPGDGSASSGSCDGSAGAGDASGGGPQAAEADEVAVPAAGAGVYSHVSVRREPDADLGPARDYNIDLAAKAVLCAGPLVKALLDSGAHNYVEFKALSSSWLWRGGRLAPVPATRADVFAAEGLTLPQRRALMRFLTSAQAAMQGGGPLQGAFDGRPFAQLLAEQGLQPGVRALLLYAVALLEADQEPSSTPMPLAALPPAARAAAAAAATPLPGAPAQSGPAQPTGPAPEGAAGSDAAAHAAETAAANPAFGGGVATAAQGLEALRLYMQSAGKYGPGTGAFLLPCYGTGELPQAFCRVAAVAGAMYVLRRPESAILLHPGSSAVRGVRLASGQELQCSALAGDADAFAGLQEAQEAHHGGQAGSLGSGTSRGAGTSAAGDAAATAGAFGGAVAAVRDYSMPGSGAAVARAVAVTETPFLQQGGSGSGSGSALVIFPPHSLPSGNAAAVRVLQVGSGTSTVPQGRFLLHAATAAGATPGSPPPGLRDVEEALAQLVRLPTQQQQPQPQPQPQQQQQQQQSAAAQPPGEAQTSGRPDSAADGGSTEAHSRPHALLLASWVQSTMAVPEVQLPANAACSPPPDGSLDFRAALAAAAAAFAKLFPEAAAAGGGRLFGSSPVAAGSGGAAGTAAGVAGGGAADEDSDDDTLAALQAALAGLGGGSGSSALGNGMPGTGRD